MLKATNGRFCGMYLGPHIPFFSIARCSYCIFYTKHLNNDKLNALCMCIMNSAAISFSFLWKSLFRSYWTVANVGWIDTFICQYLYDNFVFTICIAVISINFISCFSLYVFLISIIWFTRIFRFLPLCFPKKYMHSRYCFRIHFVSKATNTVNLSMYPVVIDKSR